MSEKPLKNKIISWLKEHHYWFQYTGNKFLEGEDITESTFDQAYQLFKEDHGLKLIEEERKDITFNETVASTDTAESTIQLKSIQDIRNVNALAEKQAIAINPNLTIIYGGNGAGKSGYIRLLNNAFSSRGDKNILPNVFSEAEPGPPYCKFTFDNGTESYDLEYPLQKERVEFAQFSVFDSHSIKVILEQDNKLDFTPIGFEFFEKTLKLIESIKNKLSSEIIASKSANEFNKFFTADNEIRKAILNLGQASNEEELKLLATYSETDNSKLEELKSKLEELKVLNISKKIDELQKLESHLSVFITRQQDILDILKPENIDGYKKLIEKFHKLNDLAKQEGINSLKEYKIDELGSSEWKDFITMARVYANKIKSIRNENYPSDKDNCLFCLQLLTEKENQLVKSYWNILASSAEQEYNRTVDTIRELEKRIKALPLAKFDETTTLFEYVYSTEVDLAKKWKDIVSSTEIMRQNIIINLSNKNQDLELKSYVYQINDFENVLKKIQTSITELFEKNPEKEIKKLETEIQFLTDKSLLNKLLEQVLNFVKSHKWASAAEHSLGALNTKGITIKQGELFAYHITDKYKETFEQECKFLNAPNVQVAQINVKGSTLRKLQVKGIVANTVLSEGEQRVISLSDFLTEAQLNPNNKGVIFDDPITSQDHIRREKIAERLVQLSAKKQVIIFTHDIAFFIRLKILSEGYNIPCSFTTIRNIGGSPGIIKPDLPWIAQPLTKRISTLRDRLVRLSKIEKNGNEDDYLFEAKAWYGLLREGWERAVEERLFKGIVERFLVGVQTQKLKKLNITQEMLKDIEEGMTKSSNWLHDAASGLNPTPPTSDTAANDLNFLDSFASKCVAA